MKQVEKLYCGFIRKQGKQSNDHRDDLVEKLAHQKLVQCLRLLLQHLPVHLINWRQPSVKIDHCGLNFFPILIDLAATDAFELGDFPGSVLKEEISLDNRIDSSAQIPQ